MGQNNTTPSSSEYPQDIRFYTLFQFGEETIFDTGEIREISHYKETKQPGEAEVFQNSVRIRCNPTNPGLPEHEFLLVKVVGHSPQSTCWLRLDRSRQDKAKSLPNKSSSIFPANDTVSVAEKATSLLHPPSSSSRMCSLQYNVPSEPSLADFRYLLRLIHNMSPEYKLWQEQCYWFCNSIMVIMERQFPTELVLEEAHRRRGKFKKIVLPSNADSMTKIQTAFKSELAKNAPRDTDSDDTDMGYGLFAD